MSGDKTVKLVEVGPAHTRGDVLAYVPEDRTVFTGDILFVGGHPVVWAGPIGNWIKACDLMLSWDVETVVPGHGPITDKSGVRALKHYLEFTRAEAKKRFDAGMTDEEAARDIAWTRSATGPTTSASSSTSTPPIASSAATPAARTCCACSP